MWGLAVSYDKDHIERLRQQLRQQMNKVPERVRGGSIQETRDWMQCRQEAEKLVKRTNAGAPELLGMISRLQ